MYQLHILLYKGPWVFLACFNIFLFVCLFHSNKQWKSMWENKSGPNLRLWNIHIWLAELGPAGTPVLPWGKDVIPRAETEVLAWHFSSLSFPLSAGRKYSVQEGAMNGRKNGWCRCFKGKNCQAANSHRTAAPWEFYAGAKEKERLSQRKNCDSEWKYMHVSCMF